MRTFAQKPKGTQQTTSAQSTKPSRSLLGQSPGVRSIFQLQRTIGNQALQRSLQAEPNDLEASSASKMSRGLAHDFSRIPVHDASSRRQVQFELKVNEPGDQYEQEADRVADEVMRTQYAPAGGRASAPDISRLPAISPAVQFQTGSGASRSADAGAMVGRALQGSGQPLPDLVRARMEPAFGADFAAVRLHTGGEAAAAARAVQARAFTAGNDIVFGAGESQLHTPVGQRLLAHELTHVVQQGGGVRPPIRNRLRASSPPYLSILRTPASPGSIQLDDAPAASQQGKYELDAFVHGDSNLTSDHEVKLQGYVGAIQMVLAAHPEATIKIVGHADTTGTPETNTTIGQSRADTVKNALVSMGIAENRITTVASMGEGQLKVKTEDGVKEAKNRRVEIEIVGVAEPAPAKPETPKPATEDKPDEQPKDAADKGPVKSDDAKSDEAKDAKEGESRFKPSATYALLPYKIEVTPGKDPKGKFIVTGVLTVDYLLWKYRTGRVIFEIPATLQWAMLGTYGHTDKRWKLVNDLELGVGVNVKHSPFTSPALRNLYLKGALDLSITGGLTTDFSEVTSGGNLKLGGGYTLGRAALFLVVKGSVAFDAGGNFTYSVASMIGVTISLGRKKDEK